MKFLSAVSVVSALATLVSCNVLPPESRKSLNIRAPQDTDGLQDLVSKTCRRPYDQTP